MHVCIAQLVRATVLLTVGQGFEPLYEHNNTLQVCVAQLVRATVLLTVGQGFEPLHEQIFFLLKKLKNNIKKH